jgi:hypothetical protein
MALIKLALDSFALPIFGPEVLKDQTPNVYLDQNRSRGKQLLIDRYLQDPTNTVGQ